MHASGLNELGPHYLNLPAGASVSRIPSSVYRLSHVSDLKSSVWIHVLNDDQWISCPRALSVE